MTHSTGEGNRDAMQEAAEPVRPDLDDLGRPVSGLRRVAGSTSMWRGYLVDGRGITHATIVYQSQPEGPRFYAMTLCGRFEAHDGYVDGPTNCMRCVAMEG